MNTDETTLAALASASTFLFVPANRPERYAKALASGAGAVIIDLEDAIAPVDKQAARQTLVQAVNGLDALQRRRLVVRINAAGTPWHADDLAALRDQGMGAVMVSKAESAATLAQVASVMGPACALLPLIESVAGLDAVDALAACSQVLRLVFGHLDFQADAGLACGPDESELVPVRLALVLASRRAALAAPVDGISPGTQDTTQLALDAARSRRGGFGGKLCIHPAQVAPVKAAFAPSAAELDWARRVQSAFEQAGGGVFSLDGRMVDAPVMRLAQRTLALSQA
ncbi:CoA ester lyase [Polaromonas sp. OV174]|uniref:HpcH/HpaI aldolase/citrate lyase family protein n=1 Tax=Polaromonas sp. OV174 TaxID=1855300 RepID=UPI002101C688|nr:CoA ester lyase [Polaromonas sp. OV174]